MLIAVEGPDGSGKTSLIERLKDSLKGSAVYISRSGDKFPSILEISEFIRTVNSLSSLFKYVILDRHPLISEYIYGRVFRGGGLLQQLSIEELGKSLESVHLIYCETPPEILRQTVKSRTQMKGVNEEIDLLFGFYADTLFQLRRNPRIHFSFYNIQSADLDFEALIKDL